MAIAGQASRRRADPAEVARLFRPRSVAVLGASANPERFGGRIVPTLLRRGYAGRIYPINPGRDAIAGVPCHPDLASVPGDVDCLVYAVAAEQVRDVMRQATAKKVRLLVMTSAGFAERGDVEGRRLQEDMLAAAREGGIRVLGPNCIGFANLADETCVTASAILAWPHLKAGRIGLVSQSGGLGLGTIAHDGVARGIGFSHLVNTGNEADLDTIDVARFLVRDEATDVVAITIEAVQDTDGFVTLLREAGDAGKPLVVLKSGRSDLGKVMAASHTGALAGSAAVFESVCRQFGVTVADDVNDVMPIAEMFSKLRRAGKLGRFADPGAHLAALSLSGGHVGLFADHASLAGLRMPPFAPETTAAIAGAVGFEGNYLNPLDTTARVLGDDAFWGRCTEVVARDPAVEVVVPIITIGRSYERPVRDFLSVAERSPKIVIVLWAGGDQEGDASSLLRDGPVPFFSSPSQAARAIRDLDRWCRVWSAGGRRPATAPATSGSPEARALLLAARRAGRRSLTERESKAVLFAAGMPVTAERAVRTVDEAVAAAAAIGFPVVLKGEHPEILHKSEAGLVLLGLADEAAVRDAFAALAGRMARAAPPSDAARTLVQEMVPPGTELILGMSRDPEFGVVVLLGMGGIFAEVLDDATTRLPPFDREEACRMVAELRGRAVLEGARGRTPARLDALADLLVLLGDFACHNRDLIEELDVNPLIAVGAAGFRAADGLIVLHGEAPPEEMPHGD